jgi:hypothetical protein
MEYKKYAKEKEDLIANLVDVLDEDDITCLVSEWMKKNAGGYGLMAKFSDTIGGQDMVYFRMKAEQKYYLDDSEEWD